jgi:PAS domain S-box-containing protein
MVYSSFVRKGAQVDPGAAKLLDVALYRRGRLVTLLARWTAALLLFAGLALAWNRPGTRRGLALGVAAAYAGFSVAVHLRQRRGVPSAALGAAQDVADALAVYGVAACSGGLANPVWLLLYPHAVAVDGRGGLRYALALGSLDAAIVLLLAQGTPQAPMGGLHALAILACAFMAGSAASYVGSIHDRLSRANRDLASRNRELADELRAQEAARHEQDLAMAQIRGAEKRNRRLLERVQDAVLVIQDGRLVHANPALASMMGEPPSVLLGLDVQSLVPASYRGELWEQYRRWEAGQPSEAFETRLSTRKGEALLVSVRAAAVDFEGSRAVVAILRDIGRERRLEREIKDRAGSLAAVNEIANAVNLDLTIDDIFAVAAEEARRLVPFDRLTIALVDAEGDVDVVAVDAGSQRRRLPFPEEAVAWAFVRPFSWCETDPDPRPAHVEALVDEGARSVLALPLRAKDRLVGSLMLGRLAADRFGPELAVLEPVARHVAIAIDNARLLEDVRRRSREFESLLAIGRSIVERRALAEVLPLVTRSVNRVMRTTHCVLLLRDGDELAVAAHEGLEDELVEAFRGLRVGDHSLSGRIMAEARPLASWDMKREPGMKFGGIVERLGYRSFLGVPLRRGAEILGTLEVVTRHEERRFGPEDQRLMGAFADQAAVAIENARLFEDARSHLAGVVEANRRLEDLDRLRQGYLRNVSHEFRTPLTVIKGYAEFLMETGSPGPEGLRDVMRILVESCDRVIDLVDTLLEVSRVEQEEAERILEVQTLDLRELAAASLDPVRPAAERKGVSLDLEFSGDSMELEGDRGLLRQVVRKLVDNAVKYSPPGARVAVRGRARGEELALEVEDRGIGIAEEHLPRIFEKFYMVDGGVTRRLGGTGVGLYLVREIVRLHHGEVDVQSLPGQGSVFSVRLPRRIKPAPSRAALG